jgi:hypothetical protein
MTTSCTWGWVFGRSRDYEALLLCQRWLADTREASRRYGGAVFVARTDQPTLAVYLDFFRTNRCGKRVGLGAAMIENHVQIQVTQEQIQRLEQALEQLRQTASSAEFMAQAPAVVEHIRRIRAEIDVYLGLPDIASDAHGVSLHR